MEPQAQTTNTATSTEASKYAGFWTRFVAMLIDSIILGAVATIAGAMFGAGKDQLTYNSLAMIIAWAYAATMESSQKQGTVGKLVLKIKVTDMEGNRISFWQATGRHFAKIISTVILFIGFLMAGWTEKKQGLHDILAKTLVVRK